jgi:hypothetical protein
MVSRSGILQGKNGSKPLPLHIIEEPWAYFWFMMLPMSNLLTTFEIGCGKSSSMLLTTLTRLFSTSFYISSFMTRSIHEAYLFEAYLVSTFFSLQILIGNKCDMLDKKVLQHCPLLQ